MRSLNDNDVSQALADFRDALTQQARLSEQRRIPAPARPQRPVRWSLALGFVAALLALTIPALRYSIPSGGPAERSEKLPARVDARESDDDALLRQIETEVSRPVAPSLQPLEALMVSDTSFKQER